jgi:hypothetical protein
VQLPDWDENLGKLSAAYLFGISAASWYKLDYFFIGLDINCQGHIVEEKLL